MAGNRSKKMEEKIGSRHQMSASLMPQPSDTSHTFPGTGHILGRKTLLPPQERGNKSLIEHMVNELVCHEGFWCELQTLCSALKRGGDGRSELVETVMSNPALFKLSTKYDAEGVVNYVRLHVDLNICSKAFLDKVERRCTGDCNDLHICEGLLSGLCTDPGMCERCHDLQSRHNRQVLANLHLEGIRLPRLLALLRCSLPNVYPGPCLAYNRGACNLPSCDLLHVCVKQFEIENECDCALQHRITENKHILVKYGISRSTSERSIRERYTKFWKHMMSMNFHSAEWTACRAPRPNFPFGMFEMNDIAEERKRAGAVRSHTSSHKGVSHMDSDESSTDESGAGSKNADNAPSSLLPLMQSTEVTVEEKRVLMKLIHTPANQYPATFQQIIEAVHQTVAARQHSPRNEELNIRCKSKVVDDFKSHSNTKQKNEEEKSTAKKLYEGDHCEDKYLQQLQKSHKMNKATNDCSEKLSSQTIHKATSGDMLHHNHGYCPAYSESDSDDVFAIKSSLFGKRNNSPQILEDNTTPLATGYEHGHRRVSGNELGDFKGRSQSCRPAQESSRRPRSAQSNNADVRPKVTGQDGLKKYTDENHYQKNNYNYGDYHSTAGDDRTDYEIRGRQHRSLSQHGYFNDDYLPNYGQPPQRDWDQYYESQFYNQSYPFNGHYDYHDCEQYEQGQERGSGAFHSSYEKEVPITHTWDYQSNHRNRVQQIQQQYDAPYQDHNSNKTDDAFSQLVAKIGIQSDELSDHALKKFLQLLNTNVKKDTPKYSPANRKQGSTQKYNSTADTKHGARPKTNSNFRNAMQRDKTPKQTRVKLTICTRNLKGSCDSHDCLYLHLNRPFGWFAHDTYLGEEISACLEDLYRSNKDVSNILLSKFKMIPKDVQTTLSHGNAWLVDMISMDINSKGKTFKLRRASTSTTVVNPKDWTLTIWKWYFKEDDGTWVPIENTICVQLEVALVAYNKEKQTATCKYTFCGNTYEADVVRLTQLNTTTKKERELRRRPAPQQVYDKHR